MRDRFISGNLNRPVNRMPRLDILFRHEWILTCGQKSLSRRESITFALGFLALGINGRQLEAASWLPNKQL